MYNLLLSLQIEVQTTKAVSQRLLKASEQIGRLLSDTLDLDANETVSTALRGSRNNIG